MWLWKICIPESKLQNGDSTGTRGSRKKSQKAGALENFELPMVIYVTSGSTQLAMVL